jgi:hypothetical protein
LPATEAATTTMTQDRSERVPGGAAPEDFLPPKACVPGKQGDEGLTFIAYRLETRPAFSAPVPASRRRVWADNTQDRFAYRCLPILMANQAGWVLCSPAAVEAVWLGGEGIDQLQVSAQAGNGGCPAASHFGHGILTWIIPFLFRTPPDYNLLVRGPANAPKDGISALEGLVETDWAMSTFTMNWKVTRPNTPISFEEGEPICMVVPQRRGELEAFAPAVIGLHEAEEIDEHYSAWSDGRRAFNAQLTAGPVEELWQKHYFRGKTPSGLRAEEHQTSLRLRAFGEDSGAGKNASRGQISQS